MNQELELAPTVSSEGDAAAAFGHMAARLSLLEAAITGLAAQRSANDIPDYSETLGEIASDVEDAAEALEKLAASPLLALTPDQVARQISQAGKEVRAADHGALAQAQAAMDGWARSIGAALASASECWWGQWSGPSFPAPSPAHYRQAGTCPSASRRERWAAICGAVGSASCKSLTPHAGRMS
jgi:hypothetical protein